ncbi:hypothetical protein AAGT00_01095 (plasmid) [Streptomyces cavourensis]
MQALALCVPAAEAPTVVVGSQSGDGQASTATCPSGTKVANGGFFANTFHYANGGTMYDAVRASYPSSSGSGWSAQLVKGKVQALALCTPQGGAPTVAVGAQSSDGQASTATCPSGRKAVAGGHFANTFHYANGGEIYDAVRASYPTTSGNGWAVQLLKGKSQAFALCVTA